VREGKRVALVDQTLERAYRGQPYCLRRVVRVIERTSDRQGQTYLVAEIELEGWWTSLAVPGEQLIELYADHATCEQLHSELKTDLDVERLPSGKFDTNALVGLRGGGIQHPALDRPERPAWPGRARAP